MSKKETQEYEFNWFIFGLIIWVLVTWLLIEFGNPLGVVMFIIAIFFLIGLLCTRPKKK